jgi:hypothetical protein
MTMAPSQPITTTGVADAVLDVPREDEADYCRRSYHEFLRAWDDLVSRLIEAHRSGDRQIAARVDAELRRFWPRPREVADARWIPEAEREHPLAGAQPG